MNKANIWGWSKKTRTTLKNIKAGDIFCFTQENESYYFGIIISKIITGHVAEIFKTIKKDPLLTPIELEHIEPLTDPIVLDSYSLFDKKTDPKGEWRIIGHQEVTPTDRIKNYYFAYGTPESWTKVSALNVTEDASEHEIVSLPPLTPLNNYKVSNLLRRIQNQSDK
ncbi:phosphotriesterase [Pantoea sp. Ap-967]|uniref:Imm26 family immunity protein n=1 Tax=Pantoea sp. Ap-967 TaxID=2608362 RepID=UPI001423C0B1|nr:Imm26 family immunity protein [Pantoea sp. Ap-967]NIE78608.1 phosphotriesterase [Pantoea sp. Ap-967]